MMRVALLCCQREAAAEAGMIFGVPAEQQQQQCAQGSKLRPFWSHMLPKCYLCDSKIYLGAFVRVQIIAVVRPLQFSAKRSRITARMCHVTGS